MSTIAIGVAQQKRRAFAAPRPLDQADHRLIDRTHILPVHLDGVNVERARPRQNLARGGLGKVGVFVVKIVLAHVNDRQLPERGHIHHFIQHTLSQRAFAKEHGDHLIGAAPLGRKGCARGNARAAAHDGVRAQVAHLLIGNVHRAALAAAIAGRAAQQLAKHAVESCAFSQAVAVPAMRAGDVIIAPQRLAHAHGDAFFAGVEMRQAGHLGGLVQLVHLLLEHAYLEHLLVHVQPLLDLGVGYNAGSSRCG